MDMRRLRLWLLLMPLLFGAAALILLFLLAGGQAGGAVLIGPVPVAVGTSPWAAALALLLLLALFVLTTGWMLRATAEAERVRRGQPPDSPSPETPPADSRDGLRGAGVIMVGPLPIAFGNDPRLLRFTLLLAVLLAALGIVATLWARS